MFARSSNELRYNSDCLVGGPAAACTRPLSQHLIRTVFRVHWDGKSKTITFL